MQVPSLEDIAREAGLLTIPKGGSWVAIKGLPNARRGNRIIPAHREIGIEHLDIYWAWKEVLCFKPRVNRFRKRNLELPQAALYDMMGGDTAEDAMCRASRELLEYVDSAPWWNPRWQISYISISHPYPAEVRFFNSEVAVLNADCIRLALEEDCLETVVFGQTVIPALEDALQEIVDALCIDGLSRSEAYHHALTHGVIEPGAGIIPAWFYRPIGILREAFVEGHDK